MVMTVPEVIKCSVNSNSLNNNTSNSIDLELLNQNNKIKQNSVELGHILQISLDTDKIIQSFFKYIKHQLKLTNLLYINNDHDIEIQLGNKISVLKSKNKKIISFELNYNKDNLGELTLASKTELSPAKQLELKAYVKLLILPLKNCLLYTKALKETRTDPLTKISNRLALYEDLNYHFSLSNRYSSNLSILFLDIDYFKNLNDKYGHLIGDDILINLADLLKTIIRKSDILYRFGGEEFVILLDHTNKSGAINLAKKLIDYTNRFIIYKDDKSDTNLNISISIGVATKNPEDTKDSLLHRADKALYSAKSKGRNCYVVKNK